MGELIFSISYGGALIIAGVVSKVMVSKSTRSLTQQTSEFKMLNKKEVN
ncbi:hypothetical protein [Pseudalkalibacillus decolorationis]|nr:hypothetical protein [Pseudalkalibacillus decolorationis]